jgi:DNA polymerase-3 subunit delta'
MMQVLGQSKAMGQIQAAVSSGRLHHAWIFHGPWGVGKFTAALELARFLLCHDPQTDLMGTPGTSTW